MFTGIVQGTAEIETVSGHSEFKSLKIAFPQHALKGIKQGASVAINGTCLTVTEFDEQSDVASFDVIGETLDKTNLSQLTEGASVNFERAARIGDEIGGHIMSGHIHTTVDVIDIIEKSDNITISFGTPLAYEQYLLPKGFVGLNGCSLTLGTVEKNAFKVHLIPETLSATTFGIIAIGDNVNLEIDTQTQTIVDTVKRVLEREHN